MKKSILLATTAMIASGVVATSANAVDVELYGQVNKGIMVFDDGVNTEINIVDNDFSSTRFGVRGSQALDNGLTASVLLEGDFASNDSNTLTQQSLANQQDTPADQGAASFTERHARVGLAGDWGAVFVGRTSTATDGVTEIDLGPVSDVMGSAANRIGGGLLFGNGAGGLTAISVSNMWDNFDGIAFSGGAATDGTLAKFGNGLGDRASTFRYDSPILEGFQARVAMAQEGDADIAVYYNGKMDAFEVAAGLGYVFYNDITSTDATARDEVETQISGSISVKHDSGVSISGAYGERDYKKQTTATLDEPSFYYVKLGYAWDNWGVAVDYGQADSTNRALTVDHETTATGVGAQYDMGHGVSLAGYYRQFDADITGTTTDEVDVYGVNLRVKF